MMSDRHGRDDAEPVLRRHAPGLGLDISRRRACAEPDPAFVERLAERLREASAMTGMNRSSGGGVSTSPRQRHVRRR